MDNVNVFATGHQSGVPLQYGKTVTKSSEITAENSPSLTTSGSTSRSVKPSPIKNGGEMSVTDYPKERVDSSGQTQSLRKRIIENSSTSFSASGTVISTQGSKEYRPYFYDPFDEVDRGIQEHHIESLRKITPSYKSFPASVSNRPMDELFAEHTIHWLQHINTSYEERSSVMTSIYDFYNFHKKAPLEKVSVTKLNTGLDSTSFSLSDSARADCSPSFAQMYEGIERLELRKRLGIFYPEDYKKYELPELLYGIYLGRHTLPEFFDLGNRNSFVAVDNGHTPSECLNAFFHGPTLADCATALLACQYRAIESIIGTDEFNRIFGAPISKFRISCTIMSHTSKHTTNVGNIDPIDASNPIYDLFYNLSLSDETGTNLTGRELSERNIKKGDIIYIQGVESYLEKHKSGCSIGFNLMCTGQNSSGQNLYLGFGPDRFDEPKTYDQVKKILIDGYNKPQNSVTNYAIKKGETQYARLKDSILPHDHPIIGITCALRFSNLFWEYFSSQRDQVWHHQPRLPVTPTMEPKPVHQVSPFTIENLDADLDQLEPDSEQQELMRDMSLKFTHAVINNQGGASHKKPMGLFLTGSPGIGKTYLCVAVAKKAAEYGANVLYIDEAMVGDLYMDYQGKEEQWARKIDEMLAGKDLVVIDDANTGCLSKKFLAKTMKHVMTDKKAIMLSSNNYIPVKDATPDVINPLTREAHNFLYLSDLQGDSRRSQWWHSPEIQATDAISQLGQYHGPRAAAVITENAVSIDEMARMLSIPAEQIRQVGSPILPELPLKISPDFFLSDLSKTQHQAVFMACDPVYRRDVEQLINIVQRVHDEGLKLVVKTEDRSLLLKAVPDILEKDIYLETYKLRIGDRFKHMFQDFSESGL
ncbi:MULTISPECIES: ATP-binding protein [unclassified Endozoicomonas]|uniref:ATP-binding protein n=1 Tax=unclassified Endozoicomonas TaxID=2644528 RepID=UPI003BB0AF38